MAVTVLVPGFGGRLAAVERWRMSVALATLEAYDGGRLVVSGHGGEAERLAALAPDTVDIAVERTASSTFENVRRTLPLLAGSERIAVASDRFHRRRIRRYLAQMDPPLLGRLVEPTYSWRDGWWMDTGGAVYAAVRRVRRWAVPTRS